MQSEWNSICSDSIGTRPTPEMKEETSTDVHPKLEQKTDIQQIAVPELHVSAGNISLWWYQTVYRMLIYLEVYPVSSPSINNEIRDTSQKLPIQYPSQVEEDDPHPTPVTPFGVSSIYFFSINYNDNHFL